MTIEADLLDALASSAQAGNGQPEQQMALLRDLLAKRLGVDLPPPDPQRYRLAARAVIETIAMVLTRVQETEGAPSEIEAGFTRDMIAAMQAAGAALEAESTDWPITDTTREFFDLVLRVHILGKLFRPLGVVSAGLGLVLAGTIVARASVQPGADGYLDHDAVGFNHAGWARLAINRTVLKILQQARPALVDLFLNV